MFSELWSDISSFIVRNEAVFMALSTVCIALFTIVLAWSQVEQGRRLQRISSANYKLSMYDKRFSVYSQIIRFREVLQSDRQIQSDVAGELIRLSFECRFVLGRDVEWFVIDLVRISNRLAMAHTKLRMAEMIMKKPDELARDSDFSAKSKAETLSEVIDLREEVLELRKEALELCSNENISKVFSPFLELEKSV